MTATKIFAKWASWGPRLQSVLRIAAAIMFMLAGARKLFNWPAGDPTGGGSVKLLSQLGAAGVLETFGGGLLALGLFARPVAFLLSGEMAVAYFQVHLPRSIWPVLNGGMAAALYCFIWLYISAVGAGPWSLDAWRAKRRAPAPVA